MQWLSEYIMVSLFICAHIQTFATEKKKMKYLWLRFGDYYFYCSIMFSIFKTHQVLLIHAIKVTIMSTNLHFANQQLDNIVFHNCVLSLWRIHLLLINLTLCCFTFNFYFIQKAAAIRKLWLILSIYGN